MRVPGMLKFFCDIFLQFLNWGPKKIHHRFPLSFNDIRRWLFWSMGGVGEKSWQCCFLRLLIFVNWWGNYFYFVLDSTPIRQISESRRVRRRVDPTVLSESVVKETAAPLVASVVCYCHPPCQQVHLQPGEEAHPPQARHDPAAPEIYSQGQTN